jgi:hypothetical protein
MQHLSRPGLIAVCSLLLPGCSWMPWFGRKEEPVRFGVVSVRLNQPPPKGKRATYAVASVHDGKKLKDAGLQRVTPEGAASFVLPMGSLYDVRIFRDLNNNQSLDTNEPSGFVENIAPTPPTATDAPPVTLAFGVLGPVQGPAIAPRTEAKAAPASATQLPAELEPYLQNIPPWLQDKLQR